MAASIYSCSAILLALLASWVWVIDQNVPQPYLDEVFHIPQAQQYCAGHWRSWDPKITTPPGLYLSAAILSPILGCSTTVLRIENAVCLIVLFYGLRGLALRSRRLGDVEAVRQNASRSTASHIALNTVLFPPLFFFAALYYTDVASTLAVVTFLNCQRSSALLRHPQAFQAVFLFLLGLWTLIFRQTNIFWVAIFPAATVLVQELDTGHAVVKQSMHEGKSGFGDNWLSIVKTSYRMRVIYNPAIKRSQFEGEDPATHRLHMLT
ncbi:hypothetical protein AMS68_002499 [Peltaster fructicola]|uniref:Dol-P-Glc:Glc(2)Man(9)GlcNAc(2)-PP-Dol alpha-1,2-glucosyltransferase n=1 Tax=Peltaster fructicola TaxID=286661 RepID=A0A6H0XQD6_9PEZI|nr:hypothetical protein AMS68_002499 [Peltaster fructicola]